jgi:hypothetical protein
MVEARCPFGVAPGYRRIPTLGVDCLDLVPRHRAINTLPIITL